MFLKRILIPREVYEAIGLATISSDKKRNEFVEHKCNKTEALKSVLLNMPEFQNYITTNPEVITQIKNEFAEYNKDYKKEKDEYLHVDLNKIENNFNQIRKICNKQGKPVPNIFTTEELIVDTQQANVDNPNTSSIKVESANEDIAKTQLECPVEMINQLNNLNPNNKHQGIKNIQKLASITTDDDQNDLWIRIQSECKFRTERYSSIGGFLKNSYFFHAISPRKESADLLYWSIAQYEENIKFNPNITNLTQLMIAQQKREALHRMDAQIKRIYESAISGLTEILERKSYPSLKEIYDHLSGEKLIVTHPHVILLDTDAMDKMQALFDLGRGVMNSNANKTLADYLNKESNENLIQILNKRRGRGWGESTSGAMIAELKKSADPYKLLKEVMVKKQNTYWLKF
jgi:hypothetical protein